ncbi:hypothetical protein EPN29_01085 [bacterium]|nr:MAG: hypothetical protein EPN29_01085 [bacterium]
MLGEGGTDLHKLALAVREFQARDARRVDAKGLRSLIDALEGEFAAEARCVQRSGEHLAGGSVSAVAWLDQPDQPRAFVLRPPSSRP